MFAFPFHKLAYGPKEMAQVNALVRSRTLNLRDANNPIVKQMTPYMAPRGMAKLFTPQDTLETLKQTGPAFLPNPTRLNAQQITKDYLSKLRVYAPTAYKQESPNLRRQVRYAPTPKKFPIDAVPQSGVFVNTQQPLQSILKKLKKRADPNITRQHTRLYNQLNPRQRSAYASIIRGHELAESQVRPAHWLSKATHSHLSPDVLMREHNMITTLPEHLKPAGKPLTQLRRSIGESRFLSDIDPRLQFGAGDRLSRHARQRILELMEKKHFKDVEEELIKRREFSRTKQRGRAKLKKNINL